MNQLGYRNTFSYREREREGEGEGEGKRDRETENVCKIVKALYPNVFIAP